VRQDALKAGQAAPFSAHHQDGQKSAIRSRKNPLQKKTHFFYNFTTQRTNLMIFAQENAP
jgi:hypothetical protein